MNNKYGSILIIFLFLAACASHDTTRTSTQNWVLNSNHLPGAINDNCFPTIPREIYFFTAQSSVSGEAYQTLEQQAAWLRQYPYVKVTIEGYADDGNTNQGNLELGKRRAETIKKYFTELGISPDRINIRSRSGITSQWSNKNNYPDQSRKTVTIIDQQSSFNAPSFDPPN